jgi:hypothetical protein
MGKVASKTVEKCISDNNNFEVRHVHFLRQEKIKTFLEIPPKKIATGHINNSIFVYRNNWLNSPIKIISLVRNPFEVNISAFFENIQTIFPETRNPFNKSEILKKIKISKLIEKFKETNLSYPISWFDLEFKNTLGFDVYSFPFSQNGFQIYKNGHHDILIMRSDLDDFEKQDQIRHFLNEQDIFLTKRENVGSEKWYSEKMEIFKKELKYSNKYIDSIVESKYFQHFFTEKKKIEYISKANANSNLKK